MSTLQGDLDNLKAVGHGALTLVNAAILLAIVAVVLSNRADTAAFIQTMLQFLTWLVTQIISPISGGTNVPLSATLSPSLGTGGSGGTGSPSTTSATSTDNSPWDIPASNSTTTPGTTTTLTYAPGTPTAGITVSPTTPTCYTNVAGKLTEVIANADGTCPGS